jgi:anti-sigma28 factor (negative regulator of flagellin synthesis)
MRIDNQNLTGATPAESGRAHETEKSNRNQALQTGTAANDKTGDRVELSNTLETLSRALSANGSDRASRVQALAAQYQSGNYYPDSAATARGMISEALLAEGQ